MKCKNCNEEITGKGIFCSNCGQKNIANLNLKYLFEEILGNILNFDSKFFKTVHGLVFKPGLLSLEFLNGRRVSYAPPVRLYVILSIIFFFLISIIQLVPQNKGEEKLPVLALTIHDKKIEVTPEKYNELALNNTFDEYIRDSLEIDNRISQYIVKKTLMAQYNGDKYIDILLNQLSIFLLLFIPFISLVYKWSFRKNKYNFVNHVVFNIHFNSFVIFLFILYQLIELLVETGEYGTWIVMVCSIIYLFIAIIKFYKRKWWVATYKLIFLFIGYLFLAFVFAILLFFISISLT